ncbi:hypothetical protein FOG48_03645 [Hanseniaspora uvarum]|nr:hypothetical protein FOG48_03645 [Hanseniaspora uvarum]
MDNDVLTFTELMEKRQKDGVIENINEITKTNDDTKYLIEQQDLYKELLQQLTSELETTNQNDFVHPNVLPDDDVIDDGRVVGEFIISESHIFRNIGSDLFLPMKTEECIDFLKDRLSTMTETKFILDNKLNNLVRYLKISYSILDSDMKELADACIEHNDLKKMFNDEQLIEKNLQTGDLMPAGVVTEDKEEYIFNDEFGSDNNDSNGIMEIVEELDDKGNTIVSKLDIPIIKEVDLKDIKILGPRKNMESGNVEVPEYLKHTDPSKPAIAKEDIFHMNDLVSVLEEMEIIEEQDLDEGDEDNDKIVSDITETEIILQDIHYDYDKLNKYFVDEEEDINLNFDEEDLYDEADFDVSKMISESKTDSFADRFEKLTLNNKLNKVVNNIDAKPILKRNLGLTVINANNQNKKSVSFASSLQIKEFESHKLFNRRNTFSNMAYYMYLDQSIEIEMDEVTISNTNKNKLVKHTDDDEEEELQTESLDLGDIDDILSDTVKKLTGEDNVAVNDIVVENEVSEVVEPVVPEKKKMSRFKRESRREKRNSLIFTENSDFNVFGNNDTVENAVEEVVFEKDIVFDHSDSIIEEVQNEEEGDDSFNTLYQKSLQKTQSYFTEEELEEGRDYAQNIYIEQEEDFEEEEEDLGPIDEEEYEAQKQNNELLKKEEEKALKELLEKPYEFPEELIKAINEDKDIEIIQEPKIDYSQFRTTDEMAEAYNMGLYDDEKDEFSNKNFQRVEGMAIDYTDDSHKGYIIEKLDDFKGYNEQVEVLKDDIAEFIHNTTNVNKEEEDDVDNEDDKQVMVDIVEHEIEFGSETDDHNEDEMNYFQVSDLNDDYRLNEDVLREDISKEYQRLKQKIIKSQKSEELEILKKQADQVVNDVTENEDSRQFELLDEVGNPIKKSRFKQQRIKMKL